MQVRLPWIRSRKRLISSAFLDGILFIVTYRYLFLWKFDRYPDPSMGLAVLLAIWLLCSYVVGRYTSGAARRECGIAVSFMNQIRSTALVLLLTLLLTLIHLWFFNQDPVQATFKSFLIPFLSSVAIISTIIQFALYKLAINERSRNQNVWFFVGSQLSYLQLQKKLDWTRLPVKLVNELPSQRDKTTAFQIVVDEINSQPESLIKLLHDMQLKGSTILTTLTWCEIVLQRFPSDLISDVDLLQENFSIAKKGFQCRLKRIGDISVAAMLLIVVSPLLLIVASIIKINDGGPILYSQVRTGFSGQHFRIWKLRTMRTDAEPDGAQWSSSSDSRITWIGSMLRSTRLDELPQLWCVLAGSMSLIGPRPERPEFDLQLEKVIPHYSLRQSIRPGLSGWAQVNYPYGASIEDSANKLSYDLYYLRNFSLWLDLLILCKTIRLVLNARGALPPSGSHN